MKLHDLKRRKTKQLTAIVRRVRLLRRRRQYVTTEAALEASVALTIIKSRRRR